MSRQGEAVALAFVVLAWSSSPALELKFGHYAAETHPGHKAAVMFADAVKQRTGGKINIKIYPANQMGSPPEALEQNRLGVIYHNKICEVQKHLAITRHVYNSMVHVMRLKTWDKLTAY